MYNREIRIILLDITRTSLKSGFKISISFRKEKVLVYCHFMYKDSVFKTSSGGSYETEETSINTR